MKRFIFIFAIITLIVCIAPSSIKTVKADSTSNNLYKIESPVSICGDDSNYYIYEESGKLIHFNQSFSTFEIDNVRDMIIYNQALYMLQSDTIINTDQEVLATTVNNALGLTIINGEFYSYNNNVIANSTTQLDIFTNIKDVYAYNGYLYIIDNNILIRVNKELTTTNTIARLSWETATNFEIKIDNDNIYLMEGTILKLLSLDGTIINDSILSPTYIFDRTFKSGEVCKIADFDVYNDNIIVSDYITGSVQQFSLKNNALTFEKLVVSSFGADNDKLYNPSSLCLTANGIVIADTGNNRVMLNETILLQETNPDIVTSDNNNLLFVSYDSGIIQYNMSSQTRTNITKPQNIIDLKCNQIGELYALTNNTVLKYNGTTWITVTNLSIDPISMQCDASGQYIFIKSNNLIQRLNISTLEVIDCYASSNIIDFALDYKNNLYTLEGSAINKIQNSTITSTLTLTDDYNKFILTLNTGDIYALNKNLHSLEKISCNNFANNLASFENDLSYFDNTLLTTPAVIAGIKNKCYVYKYPFNITPLVELSNTDKVIILESVSQENTNFAYCLIHTHNNTNILGYIQVNNLDYNITDQEPSFDQVKIITALAYVYKYPTSLNFTEFTSQYTTLNYNEVVDVLSYTYNLKDYSGTSFYCVRLTDGSIGYINTRTAMNSQLDVYQKSFQPNAKVKKSLDEERIVCYNLIGNEYTPSGKELTNDQYIFLSSELDTNNTHTKVVYLNENNEQLSTYIETKYIYVSDLTKHKYIGLILLIVALIMGSIITALIVITKKNKKYIDIN